MARWRWLAIRLWIYFRRGHGGWMTFILSFLNFIVIQYNLLVERIHVLRELFPNLTLFTVAVVLVYAPLAILIGRWDYKRASVPMEHAIAAYYSPWNQDLARALIHIARGEAEEAQRILEKWIPRDR